MKKLTLDEFIGSGLNRISHILHEAAIGNESYCIEATVGNFIIMSEDEYNIHHDALRILLQNVKDMPQEWLDKFKGCIT